MHRQGEPKSVEKSIIAKNISVMEGSQVALTDKMFPGFSRILDAVFTFFCSVLQVLKLRNRSSMKSVDRDKVLPLSSKDLPNITVDLSLKAFVRFVRATVRAIPPKTFYYILFGFTGILYSHAKAFINPSDFKFVKTIKNTPKTPLNFEDAIFTYLPEMAIISCILISNIQTWIILVLLLQAGELILLLPVLISGQMLYILHLIHKTSMSGIYVACGGSMNLPLFGFITLGVFELSLFLYSFAFLIVYFIWRFLYEGKSTGGGKDIHLVILKNLDTLFDRDSGPT